MDDFNYYQYRQNIYKPKKFIFTILFVLIISLSAILLNIKTDVKIIEFYFIEIGKFSNYTDALNFSISKQEKENIFCYIYFDNCYHVFSSFHSDIEQAKNEIKNLNTKENCKFFSISTNKISKQKSFSKNQNNLLKNIFQIFIKVNKLTNFQLNEKIEDIKFYVKNLISPFNDLTDKFNKEFKNDFNIKILIKNLNNMKIFMEKILNFQDENFTENFKFNLINIAMEEIKFLNHF